MKKFFSIFFTTLGVIFFIIILAGIYFFITDPLNLKPLIFNQEENQKSTETDVDQAKTGLDNITEEDKNPALSPAQEKALETVGIESENIPSSFTPTQISCFENILGKERVMEIKAGDTPTATEFYKAKECI